MNNKLGLRFRWHRFRTDPRGWLARRFLSLANRVDPQCKWMGDAREHWEFRRGWVQPKSKTDFQEPTRV